MTTRANFCIMKFISFDAFEQLNRPNAFGPPAAAAVAEPVGGPIEGLVPGRGAQCAVLADDRLGQPGKWLSHPLHHLLSSTESYPEWRLYSRPLRLRGTRRVVFVCGNGSAGISRPSAAQIGPQPSPGRHSTSRSAERPSCGRGRCGVRTLRWRHRDRRQSGVNVGLDHRDDHPPAIRPRLVVGRHGLLEGLERSSARRSSTTPPATRAPRAARWLRAPPTAICSQNAHAGQSTVAENPDRNDAQSTSSPRVAAAHTAVSSSRPMSSLMW